MPEIDIIIKKSESGQGQAPTPQAPQSDREPGKSTLQNQAVNAALISAGKQIMLQGINQYAELSGNYAMAESINATLSIGADVALLATGPVGTIAVASKYLLNVGNALVGQTRARQDVALARERAGAISTKGSRYD